LLLWIVVDALGCFNVLRSVDFDFEIVVVDEEKRTNCGGRKEDYIWEKSVSRSAPWLWKLWEIFKTTMKQL